MKKYRVNTKNGVMIIDANNIHSAISKAREQLGYLPNDINVNISDGITRELNVLRQKLQDAIRNIGKDTKELEWDNIYKTINDCSNALNQSSYKIKEMSGSMFKVDKSKLED